MIACLTVTAAWTFIGVRSVFFLRIEDSFTLLFGPETLDFVRIYMYVSATTKWNLQDEVMNIKFSH
jgi:hypothetical protein